jgi:hypothetical protein
MSLNIKSERTVALVRELAARTGRSQTAAVEEAVSWRLAELDRDDDTRVEKKRTAAADVLRQLHRLLTDDEKRAIRRTQDDLYDDVGLPR